MHRRVKLAIVNKTVTDLGNYWNLQYSTTTLHKNIDLFSCKLLQSNPLCSMNIIKTMRDAWSCKTHLAILTPCHRSSLSLRFPSLFPSRLPCGKGFLHCGLKKKVEEDIKGRQHSSMLVGMNVLQWRLSTDPSLSKYHLLPFPGVHWRMLFQMSPRWVQYFVLSKSCWFCRTLSSNTGLNGYGKLCWW